MADWLITAVGRGWNQIRCSQTDGAWRWPTRPASPARGMRTKCRHSAAGTATHAPVAPRARGRTSALTHWRRQCSRDLVVHLPPNALACLVSGYSGSGRRVGKQFRSMVVRRARRLGRARPRTTAARPTSARALASWPGWLRRWFGFNRCSAPGLAFRWRLVHQSDHPVGANLDVLHATQTRDQSWRARRTSEPLCTQHVRQRIQA
jgi:hypothetical protein